VGDVLGGVVWAKLIISSAIRRPQVESFVARHIGCYTKGHTNKTTGGFPGMASGRTSETDLDNTILNLQLIEDHELVLVVPQELARIDYVNASATVMIRPLPSRCEVATLPECSGLPLVPLIPAARSPRSR
jgi:hypothetical protein